MLHSVPLQCYMISHRDISQSIHIAQCNARCPPVHFANVHPSKASLSLKFTTLSERQSKPFSSNHNLISLFSVIFVSLFTYLVAQPAFY